MGPVPVDTMKRGAQSLAHTLWEGAEFPLSREDVMKKNVQRTIRANSQRKFRQKYSASAETGLSKNGTPSLKTSRQRGHSHVKTSANMRILSKTSSTGWSWLSVKFKEVQYNKISKPRKGELPQELVKAIWGAHSLRSCNDLYRNFSQYRTNQDSFDLDAAINKIRSKRREQILNAKPPKSLMDVLLQNWSYFDHAHANISQVERHVHAKYCENEFGHFLLPSGHQIHGQFNVPMRLLVKELRKLMAQLRSQTIETHYQELPVWKSPSQEELPELEIPAMPAMPQLYPIEGLLPVPSEEDECIPNDLPPPVFKSPVLKEYPPLLLPQPLKIPALRLPVMPTFIDDESTIDYEDYKEIELPTFKVPEQKTLPLWLEPQIAELPVEPEYRKFEIIPEPVLEVAHPFRPPLLDPHPCQKSYYELDGGEIGICDGLCGKSGHKRYHKPGLQRKKPCLAKHPDPQPLPPPPFPKAIMEVTNKQFLPEPIFEPPPEEPIPIFQPPLLTEEPAYMQPPKPVLPTWKEPMPPSPIGWLGGQRPVFLVECSGNMAGERMEAVQRCCKALFRPGGQVEVAATHFDIIMYSFDAWSYGAIENSYLNKQAGGLRYLKHLEPMRVKTPSTIEAAMDWMSRWRPAGTTNLWKAIDIASNRTFADCIYLFSDGKPDKPVLILESLKKLAQSRGYSVPIYTIALRSPKPGCRFLKRLSDTTGGKFMELDMKWDSKCLPVKGEELDDMLWAQSLIEEYQRKNAESGVVESIKDITKRVEAQFEQKRHLPRLEAYAQLVKLAEIEHQKRVQEVRKQNEEINLRTKQVYEQLSADISERNKRNLETSKTLWKANVADIRQRNEKIAEEIEKWKVSFAAVQQRNEQAKNNAKEQFARDLKQVCEKNDQMMERAKENYQWEIEKLNKRNADTLADAVRGQQELDEMVAIVNKATREEYEVAVAAVKASNADLLFKARLSYEQQIAAIKIDNELAIQEARMQYNQKCEEVNEDNARRKVALAQRLEAIKRSREDAIAIHKEAVARCLAEHEQMGKTYSALNQANENEARIAWKKECEETERENMEAAQQAMREFSNEQVRVREENLKLAEVRMAVQRRAEEVDRKNEELVKQKKLEWKAACAEAEEKHRAAVAEAKESHVKLVEKVKVRNAERLQASLLEHKVKVAAIESYNETVRPYVEASNAVRSELSRIQGFVRCMADTILQDEQEGGSSSSSRKAASVVVQEQGGRKSQVESDLETLSRCDVALNTEMLIQALQMAYGGRSAAAEESAAAAAAAMQEEEEVVCAHHTQRSLSALTPIHPARATTHHCLASPRCCAAA